MYTPPPQFAPPQQLRSCQQQQPQPGKIPPPQQLPPPQPPPQQSPQQPPAEPVLQPDADDLTPLYHENENELHWAENQGLHGAAERAIPVPQMQGRRRPYHALTRNLSVLTWEIQQAVNID